MTMPSAKVIWGDNGHDTRARELATTYASTAQSVNDKPSSISGLKSLVFWGHGDNANFCGQTPTQFVDLFDAWRKKNKELQTIEMITCNARHAQHGYTDSYTEQVAGKLKKKHSSLSIKALPLGTTPNGNANYSKLLWHPGTSTWAYVAGVEYIDPGGSTAMFDKNMSDLERILGDFMPPRGELEGYQRAYAAFQDFQGMSAVHPMAVKYKWDQARIDEYNDMLRRVRQNSYVIAGTLGTLRWCLEEIR